MKIRKTKMMNKHLTFTIQARAEDKKNKWESHT